jgi:ParB/RepB/Spo0J family partition protein
LMGSMQKDGLLQPIGVRKLGGGEYEAVFGNRRIIAAKKLGWGTIPAHVLDDVENENDRDILNLLENWKRTQTTVYEDGRIMSALVDRGLSVKEIAVRLNCSETRVQTALDVYSDAMPKEFQKIIVNTTTNQRKPGTISATAATQILSISRKNNLNRKQKRKLLEFAKHEDTTVQHIAVIAPMVREGLTIPQAINASKCLDRVALFFFMDKRTIDRLEKKYGAAINEIVLSHLEKNKEFAIKRAVSGEKYDKRRWS